MDRRRRLGQYPTPVWVAEALIERHFATLNGRDLLLEPACGPGAFLGAVPGHVPAVGVEIDAQVANVARETTGRRVITGDFLAVPLDFTPTVIVGNPPFDMAVVDGFLARAWQLLPEGGRVGFILPAYAFQTATRVASYADQWSIQQEFIPRNVFNGLSLPIVFALFLKDFRRKLVGFALYQEAADVQRLPAPYRAALSTGHGPIWVRVVEEALARLGGSADLREIYTEVEGCRPTRTKFWREQIRKVVRASARFKCVSAGRYALNVPLPQASVARPIQLGLAL